MLYTVMAFSVGPVDTLPMCLSVDGVFCHKALHECSHGFGIRYLDEGRKH